MAGRCDDGEAAGLMAAQDLEGKLGILKSVDRICLRNDQLIRYACLVEPFLHQGGLGVALNWLAPAHYYPAVRVHLPHIEGALYPLNQVLSHGSILVESQPQHHQPMVFCIDLEGFGWGIGQSPTSEDDLFGTGYIGFHLGLSSESPDGDVIVPHEW